MRRCEPTLLRRQCRCRQPSKPVSSAAAALCSGCHCESIAVIIPCCNGRGVVWGVVRFRQRTDTGSAAATPPGSSLSCAQWGWPLPGTWLTWKTTGAEATCGTDGDCQTYKKPILAPVRRALDGVFGLIGHVTMITAMGSGPLLPGVEPHQAGRWGCSCFALVARCSPSISRSLSLCHRGDLRLVPDFCCADDNPHAAIAGAAGSALRQLRGEAAAALEGQEAARSK